MIVANDISILIVEDHDFQRRTLARMLRSLGAKQVLEAENGSEALLLMQKNNNIDLIICDLDMPKMDGMEFIRHLGKMNCNASIIISSMQDRSLLASVKKMATAYGVSVIGVIEKPVTLDILKDLISQYKLPEPRQFTSVNTPSFSLDQILEGVELQQFEPYYQPKLNLNSGKIVGAEALARWCHPKQGLLLPHCFIAQLEQSENINELTFQMLEQAGRACKRWHDQGLDLSVSVNFSLVSLTDTDLADKVTEIISKIGLSFRHMILEITETVAMTNIAPALENLTRLRMRGFGLSIDDYGTGFASMQQLTRIPFSELKIDQSFILDQSNISARAFVKSTVAMAHRLNIKTIAEGIETQAHYNMIKAAGCNMIQGYFIAKAMEESQFIDFCKAQKKQKKEILKKT